MQSAALNFDFNAILRLKRYFMMNLPTRNHLLFLLFLAPISLQATPFEAPIRGSLFSKLMQLCTVAGGNWEGDGKCYCGDGVTDKRVFDASTKSCRNLSVYVDQEGSECERNSFETTLEEKGIKGLNQCLTFVQFLPRSAGDPFNGTGLIVEFGGNRVDDAKSLAKWADRERTQANPFAVKLWGAVSLDELKIYTGAEQASWSDENSDFLNNVVNPNLIAPDPAWGDLSNISATYYERDAKFVGKVLGITEYSPTDLEAHFSTPDSQLANAHNYFKSLFEYAMQSYKDPKFASASAYALRGEGCDNYCRVFSRETEMGGYRLVSDRYYSKGSVFREVIWAKDQEGRFVGGVLLSPSGLPNLYFALSWKETDGRIQLETQIYDREFAKVAGRSVDVSNAHQLRDQNYSFRREQDIRSGEGILLCEHVDPRRFRFSDSILRGPHDFDFQNGEAIGSLFGWESNHEHDWSISLQEFLDTTTPSSRGFERSHIHGNNVSEIIKDGFSDAKFLIGGGCFQSDQVLMRALQNDQGNTLSGNWVSRRVKVINASYAAFEGPLACQGNTSPFREGILKDTLLVAAAGNVGLNNPGYCPQRVGDARNKIVVSGVNDADSDHPSLAKNSAFGKDYADIGAEQRTLDGSSSGTSYAAPRISAVAARIAAENNLLTATEIRLAILTSAFVKFEETKEGNKRVYKFHPIDVRSGGVLRSKDALKIGHCMQTRKENDRDIQFGKEIMSACLRDELSPEVEDENRYVEEKVNFLESRGNIF